MISKRAPAKTAPGMWETTGGGAVAGESGLEAAVREVREELGIALRSESGRVFTRYTFLSLIHISEPTRRSIISD